MQVDIHVLERSTMCYNYYKNNKKDLWCIENVYKCSIIEKQERNTEHK